MLTQYAYPPDVNLSNPSPHLYIDDSVVQVKFWMFPTMNTLRTEIDSSVIIIPHSNDGCTTSNHARDDHGVRREQHGSRQDKGRLPPLARPLRRLREAVPAPLTRQEIPVVLQGSHHKRGVRGVEGGGVPNHVRRGAERHPDRDRCAPARGQRVDREDRTHDRRSHELC